MSLPAQTASTLAAPAITNVLDSQNRPVPNGSTTADTALTLSGTATPGAVVVISDNSEPIGSASVTTSGSWGKAVMANLGDHSYTAKVGTQTSSPWVVTIVAVDIAPTVTRIEDPAGEEIGPGESTFDTAVTLTGTAVAGQQVQIFDGTTSLGTVTATGGTWTLPLTGLAVKAYSIKVRGLYGSNPESAVRAFTVAAATTPTISSIKDSGGTEIPAGATTFSTSVTLTGTAVAGQQVQIFDGTMSLGTVIATGGTWTLPLTGLAVKAYSIKARGLYGSNPESQLRDFIVAQLVEDFESAREGDILQGQPQVLPTMTIQNVTSSVRITNATAPPYVINKCLYVYGVVHLTFVKPFRGIKFGASLEVRGAPIFFHFYDEHRQLIEAYTFTDAFRLDWFEFGFSSVKAKSVRIFTQAPSFPTSTIWMDNFTFTE